MRGRKWLAARFLMALLALAACRRPEAPAPAATPTERVVPSPTATEAPEPTRPPEPSPIRREEPPAARNEAEELELVGVVRGGAGGPSALIALDERQEMFRRGDAVFDHGTLKEIRDDSVVVHSGGRDVTLRLAREAPAVPAPPPREASGVSRAEPEPAPIGEPLSRAETHAAMQEFGTILSRAGGRRVSVGGGHGVEIANPGASPFLVKLGLRSGDVLQKLNGIPIEDPDNLPDLSAAAAGKELAVSFSRDDVGLTITRRLQ